MTVKEAKAAGLLDGDGRPKKKRTTKKQAPRDGAESRCAHVWAGGDDQRRRGRHTHAERHYRWLSVLV